jgi:F-box protein 11
MTANPFQYDVFLSHNHQDKPQVRQLATRLRDAGLNVWFDEWSVRFGDDIYMAVEQGLEISQTLLLCLSPHALGSDWVTLERSTVLFRDPANKHRRFIPLLLADCTLPDTLRRYKYIDFRTADNTAFGQLLAACQNSPTAAPASPAPAAKATPTHIVDALHRGHFATISAAIAAAKPGDRLLIRPGLYQEGLVINKPLEIIGDGDRDDIIIEAKGQDVILFKTSMGIVRNVSIRQLGGGNWFGVDIGQGRLHLEDCDITSQSLACVAIHDGANPVVRHNRIHDGKQGGIYVYNNGRGTLEDNDIFGNTFSGLAIQTQADPVVRRNRIHDNKAAGVHVYEYGRGTLEDNDIFGNAKVGLAIQTQADPVVRRNRIHDGKAGGVYVNEDGRGTLEDNDIFGNAYSGIQIQENSTPTLRRNRITKNLQYAIHVHSNGGGTIEHNDLRGNTYGAWLIKDGCTVKRNGNQET